MKLKAIFSAFLITSFCGVSAFANSCLTPVEDLVNQYRRWDLNNCRAYVYANYRPIYHSQADEICEGKGPAVTKCLIDITEKTKVLLRAPNRGLVEDGFDCPMYQQKIMNPNTAASICASGTSDDYTTCVAELFQKGGIPLVSDSKPSGVSLCQSGWKKDLNNCIIQKYQSGRYTGEQAATECVIARNGSTQEDVEPTSKTNASAKAQAQRQAYEREQAEKLAAETRKREEQQKRRDQDSNNPTARPTPPPAPDSSSSSGDVIEDLPTL